MDDFGNEVTVQENEDNVQLYIPDSDYLSSSGLARMIQIVDIDTTQSHEEIVLSHANPNPPDATCSIVRLEEAVEGRDTYLIVGSIDGEQTLESVTQCTYNPDIEAPIDGLYASGIFMFFDRSPSALFIFNGEQDAYLGYEYTEVFESTIQPKE